MMPMQITAYVAGSIALARPEDLALDGLLSYQLLRRHFKDEFYYLPDPKQCLYFARIPLEMRGEPSPLMREMPTGAKWMVPSEGLLDESLWYWACSSAQIDVKGRETQYWNKRFDTQASLSDHIDFGGKVEKILIEQGRYKAYHMPLPTLVCDKVTWYAYGDMEKVADLLTGIAAIGKKRSYGNGNVIKILVGAMGHDWSEWRNNKLMRPMPGPLAKNVQWHGGFNAQLTAFRAPQWHAGNQTMCVTKGERCA